MLELPATPKADGILLHIRLTPKSSTSLVSGVAARDEKVVLKVCVAATPQAGKANAAAIEVVAAWIGIPKSRVSIATGQKSRLKSLFLHGNADELLEKLATLLRETDPAPGIIKRG